MSGTDLYVEPHDPNSRPTWADLLSDSTPVPPPGTTSLPGTVWVEHRTDSGGRKLERVSLDQLQKQESHSLPTTEKRTHISDLIGINQPQTFRSREIPNEDAKTQQRLLELYGEDLPGIVWKV